MISGRLVVVVVVLGFSLWASRSAAQMQPTAAPVPSHEPSAEKSETGQESFGFGAQIGFYNPTGVSLRVGDRARSLDLSAGFAPTLVSYGDSQNPRLKFIAPFEVSPQLLIDAITFRGDIRGGIRLGYRYNTAFGHGATLGGQLGKRIRRKLLLEGVWGLSYYPRAAHELRGDQVPREASFNFPPELAFGLTVGLLFFP